MRHEIRYRVYLRTQPKDRRITPNPRHWPPGGRFNPTRPPGTHWLPPKTMEA